MDVHVIKVMIQKVIEIHCSEKPAICPQAAHGIRALLGLLHGIPNVITFPIYILLDESQN